MKFDAGSPEKAMELFNSENQRTRVWGIDNRTNGSIEIAFGQLKGYDIPSYTTDTGVVVLGQNMGPGADPIRDPLSDTGGVPIAAYWYEVSVKVDGQDFRLVQEADEGYFMQAAVATLAYQEGALSTDKKPELSISIVVRQEKLPE